jgi:phosphoglucosamine mutase
MKKLFGTDGMRGKAGQFPLDQDTVYVVGASLARHCEAALGRKPVIVIGRDTRESGTWLEEALLTGATAEGAQCSSAGVIPTPGVAYLARMLPADAGVVISASHNEYRDNGIKIFSPSGKKVDENTERLIESDIYAGVSQRPKDLPAVQESGEATAEDLQQRYLNFLQHEIGKDLSLNNLKIVIDCANGAAAVLAPKLFEKLGASVIAINNTPDGQNINRDCGSLHIEGLQRIVVDEKADFGVAFDGDADRSLFVDSQGNFVDGDATLWVMAKHLQERGELNDSTRLDSCGDSDEQHRTGDCFERARRETRSDRRWRQVCS